MHIYVNIPRGNEYIFRSVKVCYESQRNGKYKKETT